MLIELSFLRTFPDISQALDFRPERFEKANGDLVGYKEVQEYERFVSSLNRELG